MTNMLPVLFSLPVLTLSIYCVTSSALWKHHKSRQTTVKMDQAHTVDWMYGFFTKKYMGNVVGSYKVVLFFRGGTALRGAGNSQLLQVIHEDL